MIIVNLAGFGITHEKHPLVYLKGHFQRGLREKGKPTLNVGGTNLCIMGAGWIKMNTNRPGWLSPSCCPQMWGIPPAGYCCHQLWHTFPAMADGTLLPVSQRNYFFSNIAFCQLFDYWDKKVTSNSISVEVISFPLCSPHTYGNGWRKLRRNWSTTLKMSK